MWYNVLLQTWMCGYCDKPLDHAFPLPCKCKEDHNGQIIPERKHGDNQK
jgi:hypothetical protein